VNSVVRIVHCANSHSQSPADHKVGEVKISAYFPAEVKASQRMVQANTGSYAKECLADALRDLFKKYQFTRLHRTEQRSLIWQR
jgi:hypothetical protein